MKKKPEEKPVDRRLPLADALQRLGVKSYRTWQLWLARGQVRMPLAKEGNKWFVRESDVDAIVRGEAALLYTKAEAAAHLSEKASAR